MIQTQSQNKEIEQIDNWVWDKHKNEDIVIVCDKVGCKVNDKVWNEVLNEVWSGVFYKVKGEVFK